MFQRFRATVTRAKGGNAVSRRPTNDDQPYDDINSAHQSANNPVSTEEGDTEKSVTSSAPVEELEHERPDRKLQGLPRLSRWFDAIHKTDTEGGRAWKTGFIRFGPLSGIATMIVAISSMIASLGILLGSQGVDIRDWRAPPSTYLAVLTATCNLSIRYACIQGVVIAWWYRASRGTAFNKLHHDWRSGTTIRGALTSGKHMGVLGLACIMSTIVVIDGPLLQRASIVTTAAYTDHPVALEVSIATELPTAWDNAGAWGTKADFDFTTFWSYAFNETVPAGGGTSTPNTIFLTGSRGKSQMDSAFSFLVRSNAPFSGIDGCPGGCRAKIRAPALTPTVCTTRSYAVDYKKTAMRDLSDVGHRAPPEDSQAFLVSIGLMVEQAEESIYLVTGYFDGQDCAGTFTQTACTLRSAIGEYDASITNGVMTLHNAANPSIVAVANNTPVDRNFISGTVEHSSTLGPIALQAWERWETIAAADYTPQDGYGTVILGPTASAYYKPSSGSCTAFRDPHQDVMVDMNSIMVWAAMLSASQTGHRRVVLESNLDAGASLRSSVTGTLVGDHSVYSVALPYFGAAAAVVLFCIATIAPIYWGWWTLGRPVSFSPLELAKAFESPLLEKNDSNSSGRDIAKVVGAAPIRYGARTDCFSEGTTKLAFADPSMIRTPESESKFAC